jgi:hypothetical protein
MQTYTIIDKDMNVSEKYDAWKNFYKYNRDNLSSFRFDIIFVKKEEPGSYTLSTFENVKLAERTTTNRILIHFPETGRYSRFRRGPFGPSALESLIVYSRSHPLITNYIAEYIKEDIKDVDVLSFMLNLDTIPESGDLSGFSELPEDILLYMVENKFFKIDGSKSKRRSKSKSKRRSKSKSKRSRRRKRC